MNDFFKINAVGDQCPVPVIKVRKAIRENTNLKVINISVDNEIATQNLYKMANELGWNCDVLKVKDDLFEVTISADGTQMPDTFKTIKKEKGKSVVVISSSQMGVGDEKLGKTLLKAFINTLTELDELPSYVLFYNSGAFLTTNGSNAVADLQILVDNGCKVLTCGACLNFYELVDKLEVGEVTNMYEMVDVMQKAHNIIKP